MSLPVHLVESLAGASVGAVVEVTGDEAHHAVAVRRLRVDEQVVLTDGAGIRALAVVTGTGKRLLTTRVEQVEQVVRPAPALTVVQALPKGERGELAVEVVTEVGAEVIVPWAAARSVAVWRGERATKSHQRWVGTAREAAKQARRAWFPEVTPLCTTDDVVDLVAAADLAVVLHEEGSEPLAGLEADGADSVLLVVGPEGGLTEEEVRRFAEAGARVCRLGAEVLRTSTAGVVAAGALLARTDRWA